MRTFSSLCSIWLLSGCFSTSKGYFVDIRQPSAEVVEHVRARATALNERENARLVQGQAGLAAEDSQKTANIPRLDVQLAGLYADKVLHVARRLDWAKQLKLAARSVAEKCSEKFLKTKNECDSLYSTRDAMPGIVKEVSAQLEAAQRAADDYAARRAAHPDVHPGANRVPESAPPVISPPSTVEPSAEPTLEPTEPPPESSPFGNEPITRDVARRLLEPDAIESALDDRIRALQSARDAAEERTGLRVANLAVHATAFSHAEQQVTYENGQEQRTSTQTSNYDIHELEGVTRITSAAPFATDVLKVLGVTSAASCIDGSDDQIFGLHQCDERAADLALTRTGRVGGIDTRRTTPSTLRTLLTVGNDSRLDTVMSLSIGGRSGLEHPLRDHGVDTFHRWKFAALLGAQGEITVDYAKELDDDPRFIWSFRPALGLRIARTSAFQFKEALAYEIGPSYEADLALGLILDSLGRKGLSASATARIGRLGGLYARWERYSGQAGNSYAAGLELNGALGARSAAAGVVVVLLGALLVGIVNLCDEPDECTGEEDF